MVVAVPVVISIAFFINNQAESADGVNKPNIILIRTDDQNAYETVATDQNGAPIMPNVKNYLINEGVRFTNAFYSLPLCCPSRTAVFTGQYAHNNGVSSNQGPVGGYEKFNALGLESKVLPVWLQQAGYKTMNVGKYLNGYGGSANPAVPTGWDKWFTMWGGGVYFNYKMNDNGTIVSFKSNPEEYMTDVITDKAVEYILAEKDSTRPFAMLVNYFAPHAGGSGGISNQSPVPAPRHSGLLSTLVPNFPASFNEDDVSDKPMAIQNLPKLDAGGVANITNRIHDRLESLMAVDDGVGRIISALEKTGKLNNTYLVYTSDNGYQLGEHRIPDGKDEAYEESLRMELIVRGPRVAKGKVATGLVGNLDIATTIADIAGATPTILQDGVSFTKLFRNTSAEVRSDLLIESSFLKRAFGIRTKDAKLVLYDNDDNGTVDEGEYYNYAPDSCRSVGDPNELDNQYQNPCYADVIAKLSRRLEFLKTCSGSPCNEP
jgi:arylsulfatase A-like enzyme